MPGSRNGLRPMLRVFETAVQSHPAEQHSRATGSDRTRVPGPAMKWSDDPLTGCVLFYAVRFEYWRIARASVTTANKARIASGWTISCNPAPLTRSAREIVTK